MCDYMSVCMSVAVGNDDVLMISVGPLVLCRQGDTFAFSCKSCMSGIGVRKVQFTETARRNFGVMLTIT